jgi:hypothetical protein
MVQVNNECGIPNHQISPIPKNIILIPLHFCIKIKGYTYFFVQIVKYFLDNKTFQKVKFVYPKNKDSVELMRSYFDEENLPSTLGGKSILNYNHEEFSKIMVQDDLKCADFWGSSDDKLSNHRHCSAEVAPEPLCNETPAT